MVIEALKERFGEAAASYYPFTKAVQGSGN
jgi:hypothetical protein